MDELGLGDNVLVAQPIVPRSVSRRLPTLTVRERERLRRWLGCLMESCERSEVAYTALMRSEPSRWREDLIQRQRDYWRHCRSALNWAQRLVSQQKPRGGGGTRGGSRRAVTR